MWDTVQTTVHSSGRHLTHDLPCPACGHAVHTYLPCDDALRVPAHCHAGQHRGPLGPGRLSRRPGHHADRTDQVGVADEVLGPGPRELAPLAVGQPHERTGHEDRHPGDRDHPAALPQRERQRHGPDPVVGPRDRRGDQHRQRREAGAEHPVAPQPPVRRHEQGHQRQSAGDDQPEQGRGLAVEQPGEGAVRRLVVGQRRRPDAGRVDQPVAPVGGRGGRRHDEPHRDRGREDEHGPRPPPTAGRRAPAAPRRRAASASRPRPGPAAGRTIGGPGGARRRAPPASGAG